MLDILREAPFGQLMRTINPKWFPYPEESAKFEHLTRYQNASNYQLSNNGEAPFIRSTIDGIDESAITSQDTHAGDIEDDLERQPTFSLQRTLTLPYTNERLAVEQTLEAEKTKSQQIAPFTTRDGHVLVDWYETNDQANPQNWSQKKKAFVAFQIDIYTFAVYATSAIYISSEEGLKEKFGVGDFKAALGLSLYVLGYGIGPLLWSPMSELPIFGRNVPYVGTFALFIILSVPTALSNNLGGFLFLRFLLGFFGSPCLATGGASMGDLYSLLYLPFSIGLWVSAAFAAPALGPLLSGFSVPVEGWRWSTWESLWLSSPVFILWFFFLPETNGTAILYRRAARLRKATGAINIKSQSEIDSNGLTFQSVASNAVIKPFEIMFKDPAVLFANIYTAITYGIYYSFFEGFPLVYGPIYGFNFGETTIVFLCEVIGCVVGIAIYFSYVRFWLIPDIMKNGLQAQEWRLRPAMLAVFGLTAGIFIFGWTAREDIHWIVSVIGITIFAISVYIVLQCIFIYLPMSYPQYSASLFAANDFCRSAFAFGSVLFGRPLYSNLGIGKASSLLGGLSTLGIIGIWLLYMFGARLRARSSFAQK